MEQKEEQLKETLICQYATLSHTSEIALTVKLKNLDWWIKEQYRLKVQNFVCVTGSYLVFLFSCLFVMFTAFNILHLTATLSNSIMSSAGLVFALILSQKVKSEIKEKIKLFELLQIVFNNK